MADIVRPSELPPRANPVASEVVPSDNGATVAAVTWADGVNAGRPLASQSEAEAGVQATKSMSPLTTKQAIDAQVSAAGRSGAYSDLTGLPTLGTAAAADVGDFATAAQGALADTAVQPGDAALVPAGGTTGQVLAKASDDNYDAAWTDRDFLTPQMFGAVADGVTDDTAAWLLTIAEAQSSGRAIRPAGGKSYLVSDELPLGGAQVIGDGSSTIIQDTDERGIFILDAPGSGVKGLKGVYSPTRTNPSGRHLGYLAFQRIAFAWAISDDVFVEDVDLTNFFVGVVMRGPLEEQVLSPTGYDHSPVSDGIVIRNVVCHGMDFGVTGSQYRNFIVDNIGGDGWTELTVPPHIIYMQNAVGDGSAYEGFAGPGVIRNIMSDGFPYDYVIKVSNGDGVVIESPMLFNPVGHALNVSNCVRSVVSNPIIAGLAHDKAGIDITDGGYGNEIDGGVIDGATDASIIGIRARHTGTETVVRGTRVISRYPNPVSGARNPFQTHGTAEATFIDCEHIALQTTTRKAFYAAENSTMRIVNPRIDGETSSHIHLAGAGATVIAQIDPNRCNSWDPDSSTSVDDAVGNFTLTSLGGGGDAAADVTFTPAGNIAATDVQAAIAELDSEKLALAGGTMTGNLAISNASQTPLSITQNDDGALSGPIIRYDRNSASPAASDAIGGFEFRGRDSGGNSTTYARVLSTILDPTDGSEGGRFAFRTQVAGSDAERLRIDAGLYHPSATGGDKGNNTINFGAVYDDNTLLSCYVFDAAIDGKIADKKWDGRVPDRILEAVYDDVEVDTGKKDAKGVPILRTDRVEVQPARVERRRHEDMRKFRARLGTDSDPLDLEKYIEHWRTKRHLTSMPNEATFDPVKGLPTGAWIQRLVETVEIQAVHIAQLHDRLKAAGL